MCLYLMKMEENKIMVKIHFFPNLFLILCFVFLFVIYHRMDKRYSELVSCISMKYNLPVAMPRSYFVEFLFWNHSIPSRGKV